MWVSWKRRGGQVKRVRADEESEVEEGECTDEGMWVSDALLNKHYNWSSLSAPTKSILRTGNNHQYPYPRLNSIWVDKIYKKLDFCIELGNIVGDHLPKVPKNPRPASWDTTKNRMARLEAILHYTQNTLIARFMGPTWGPTGPRWAPSWPLELCYLGSHEYFR